MEESIYIKSKIVVSEEVREKFGEDAINIADAWNEIMEQLDEDEKAELEKKNKERMTVYICSEIVNWLKNAVSSTPGLTMSSCVESALRHHLGLMELMNGCEFKNRKREEKK
jgi:hypothetical protein